MSDYVPIYQPGNAFTATASATITGRQLVEVTGSGTVGPAAAGSLKVVGVAAFDAATGAQVTIHKISAVHELLAGTGGLTAGQSCKAGAAGTIVTFVSGTDAPDLFLGTALTTATSGNKCQMVGRN